MAHRTALVKRHDPDIDTALSVSDDERLTTQAGLAVREFLRGVAGFFSTAQALERAAIATLDEAKALTPSTTLEADHAMQVFVKQTSADMKEVEAHWGITATIHGFHKRLVAARKRATDPLEEANRIGNAHHNAYVLIEQRRVAAEQERLRVAAEAQARNDREEALARQEAEALQAEAESPILSAREQRFVELVANGFNTPATSARTAGYKDAEATAARLMKSQKIQDAIQAKRTAAAIREQAEAARRQPLDYQVETVQANVSHSAGTHDRTTWSAELLDEQALIAAVLAGRHGIPLDVLMINRPRLNELARSMKTLLNAWPGCRAKSSTKVI